MTRETLTTLFETNHQAILVNVEGITDEEAVQQPHPGGNCLAWVIGHIVASRMGILKLLGEDPIWPQETIDRYKRGSPPVRGAGDGLPLSTLIADLDRSQGRLARGLANVPETRWTEPVPHRGTVHQALLFFHFHEAYHAGQTAVLRRLVGKEGAIQ